ncbi:MarR family transcriptional regulator [Methanococcoides orientis]|uniref:MarR family winged helix-turn-helix transcriptional regulator n=1 Tax=Methanococcoides orientis TaxID=2822137 RepID=UPI001E2F5A17|nr:MarR family transcriptional regulator [Methanococcoides orientis]UGV40801.1 MarR family transcriptional regulator [Methanococcoides orientis]
MDKIEQLIKSHVEMEHLKRKVEGNVTECFLKEEGCTSAHKTMNKALLIIWEEGEIMPSTLARFLDLKKSSVTSLIDSLEKEGFVYRKDDPSDRRKVLISPTEKGVQHGNKIYEKMVSVARKCMSDLDDETLDRAIEAQFFLIKIQRQMYEKSVELLKQKCSPDSQSKE